MAALLRSTVFAADSTRGSGIVEFPIVAVGAGLGYGLYGYGYDDYYGYGDGYGYDNSYYYGDSGCYIVRRSVLTRYGWRIRPVQVCS